MREISPQDFSVIDFEKHVDALQAALAKHFSFKTGKRGKLRDATAAVLFGAINGYQQIKGLLYTKTDMPEPEREFELPDSLEIWTEPQLDQIALYAYKERAYGRAPDSDDFLYQIADHVMHSYNVPEVFEPEIFVKEENGMISHADITRSNLMRYLAKHYEATSYRIDVPRIDKYGLGYGSRADEAIEIIESLGLSTEPMKVRTEQHVKVRDRGDDGGSEIFIEIRRRVTADPIEGGLRRPPSINEQRR